MQMKVCGKVKQHQTDGYGRILETIMVQVQGRLTGAKINMIFF